MSSLRALLQFGPWRPGLILATREFTNGLASGGRPGPDECVNGIPVVAVSSFQSQEAWRALGHAGIEGILCAGLNEILRQPFLDGFPHGVYGFHAGLLPSNTGASPISWAIIRGSDHSGVTLLRYSPDPCGGTVVAEVSCSLDPRETADTLHHKLAAAAAHLWREQWPRIARREVTQNPLGPSRLDPRRRPEDGRIRWAAHSAASLDCWVRGLTVPYHGAYFWFRGRRLWVQGVEASFQPVPVTEPILESASPSELIVAYHDGKLRLCDVRLDDGSAVPLHVWAELSEQVGSPLGSLHHGQRVLVIAAHPDDEVLGVGGTLIRHFKDGDEVRVLIVCSAEPIRYREGKHDQPGDSARAAFYLGAETRGLGFPDQRLDAGSNLELIQALEREIQEFRPTLVYTHYWGDVNADHVRIAEAVDVATRPYASSFIARLYAFQTPSSTEWTASLRDRGFTPNVFVDITEELERKLDAMRCYRSELRPYPHPRSLRALRERAAQWGSVANMAAAEALMLLRERI